MPMHIFDYFGWILFVWLIHRNMYVQLQSTVIYLAYHLVWFNVRSLYNKMSSFNTERIEKVFVLYWVRLVKIRSLTVMLDNTNLCLYPQTCTQNRKFVRHWSKCRSWLETFIKLWQSKQINWIVLVCICFMFLQIYWSSVLFIFSVYQV